MKRFFHSYLCARGALLSGIIFLVKSETWLDVKEEERKEKDWRICHKWLREIYS